MEVQIKRLGPTGDRVEYEVAVIETGREHRFTLSLSRTVLTTWNLSTVVEENELAHRFAHALVDRLSPILPLGPYEFSSYVVSHSADETLEAIKHQGDKLFRRPSY